MLNYMMHRSPEGSQKRVKARESTDIRPNNSSYISRSSGVLVCLQTHGLFIHTLYLLISVELLRGSAPEEVKITVSELYIQIYCFILLHLSS
jgi:hypothetical protein